MAEAGPDLSALLDPIIEQTNGGDLVTNLQNELKSLQNRVKELERENTKLASQLSSCRCKKLVVNGKCAIVLGNIMIEESKKLSSGDDKVSLFPAKEICEGVAMQQKPRDVAEIKDFKSGDKLSGSIKNIMYHMPKRYVALKIMYFGKRFYGFASAQAEPTIESEFFKALEKTRLLVRDKKESHYTRCGRTDRGVSSVGQVISLFLRSKCRVPQAVGDNAEISPEDICKEVDYVRVLNGVLPKDIRVISWCPVPNDFHARFSCLSREYKYLFWRENLDLVAMKIAGKKLVGEHDFRNFCKMDAANVHNYKRNITFFEISSCNCRSEDDQLWAMTIKGSAFLWHQIRCMVAVLFMIGQGLEIPSVIDDLLDTDKISRKPQYVMAPELPLVLQSCEFEGLKFICSSEARQSLHEHLRNEIRYYKLQAAIFQEALLSCSSTNGQNPSNHVKRVAHIPLMTRPTEPSYEERRAKQKAREL